MEEVQNDNLIVKINISLHLIYDIITMIARKVTFQADKLEFIIETLCIHCLFYFFSPSVGKVL